MSKESEYRRFAASCLEIATKTSNAADKTRLIVIAEAWLNLADRVRRLAKRSASHVADHPLVQKTLRRYTELE